MQQKDLAFALIPDEVGAPDLRDIAGILWVRVLVHQCLDHHLSLVWHDKPSKRILIGFNGFTVSDVEGFFEPRPLARGA